MNKLVSSRGTSSKRSSWRRFVIVIAEQSENGWSAWFRDRPQEHCIGGSDLLAILGLIETHGSIEMDPWDMVRLDSRSRDGHFEYLLPSRFSFGSCRIQADEHYSE